MAIVKYAGPNIVDVEIRFPDCWRTGAYLCACIHVQGCSDYSDNDGSYMQRQMEQLHPTVYMTRKHDANGFWA